MKVEPKASFRIKSRNQVTSGYKSVRTWMVDFRTTNRKQWTWMVEYRTRNQKQYWSQHVKTGIVELKAPNQTASVATCHDLDCRIFAGAKHSTRCRSSGTFISQMKISIVKTSFDRSNLSNSSIFDMYQKVNNNRNGIPK
jgi:hypothetical protein